MRSVSCKKRLKCDQSGCVDDISEVIWGEKNSCVEVIKCNFHFLGGMMMMQWRHEK